MSSRVKFQSPRLLDNLKEMDVVQPLVNIHNLPDELLIEIFQYMSAEELVACIGEVCVRWRNVANTSRLWKNLVYKPPPTKPDEEIITMLKRMPMLRIFMFNSSCFKVDEIFDVICSTCKYLHTLVCDCVVVSLFHLRKINDSLLHLQCLQLPDWQMMDDTSLYILGKLPSLKKLTHVNVGPVSSCFSSSKIFQNLEHIEIIAYCTGEIFIHEDHVDIPDAIHFLDFVPHFKSLKHLSIDFRMLQFSGFELFFQNMKQLCNLETLCFRSLFHSDMDILTKMFGSSFFPKLWKLDLGNCLSLCVDTIEAIWVSCPNVQELHFRRCVYFDNFCAEVLTKFTELRSLDLSCCNRVTEAGLEFLAHCPKLEVLDLSWRRVVPINTLSAVSTLPHLKALMLNHTQIKLEDITEFLARCQQITYLGLYCCKGIDENVIQKALPNCKIDHDLIGETTLPLTKLLKIN